VGAVKVKEYEKQHLNAEEHRGEALNIYTLDSETRKCCYFMFQNVTDISEAPSEAKLLKDSSVKTSKGRKPDPLMAWLLKGTIIQESQYESFSSLRHARLIMKYHNIGQLSNT
jgi:hypothetical protein